MIYSIHIRRVFYWIVCFVSLFNILCTNIKKDRYCRQKSCVIRLQNFDYTLSILFSILKDLLNY